MGAAEAYQTGGPWLVLVILASAVIVYLVRKLDRMEEAKDRSDEAARQLLAKSAERDIERLRRYEESEQRRRESLP